MLFSQKITVPANTSEDDPYEVSIPITKGTVRKVMVLIAVPSAWCIGVQIWYATWQVWPTTRTEWIHGGRVWIELEEALKIDQPPLFFKVRCFNDDETNEHDIWVGLSVLRPTRTSELQALFDLLEAV